jgi:hypothetical protein
MKSDFPSVVYTTFTDGRSSVVGDRALLAPGTEVAVYALRSVEVIKAEEAKTLKLEAVRAGLSAAVPVLQDQLDKGDLAGAKVTLAAAIASLTPILDGAV